jgi:hypothetical protein
MEYRSEFKKLHHEAKIKLQNLNLDENTKKEILNEFYDNYKKFQSAFENNSLIYSERNKNNKLVELEKSAFESLDSSMNDKDYLPKYRSDPFYFFEKERLKNIRKFGNKNYEEINYRNPAAGTNSQKNAQEEINYNIINTKYYLEYKNKQLTSHKNFLESNMTELLENKNKAEDDFKNLDDDLKKSRLNLDFLVRIKKSQDEITDANGPQHYIEQARFIDHYEIEKLNTKINDIYTTLKSNSDTEKDHNIILQYLELEKIKKPFFGFFRFFRPSCCSPR